MTEVADGNSIRMSAPKEVSSLDRPEGFDSSHLVVCSNAALAGPLKSPARKTTEVVGQGGEDTLDDSSHEANDQLGGLTVTNGEKTADEDEKVDGVEGEECRQPKLVDQGVGVQEEEAGHVRELVQGTSEAVPVDEKNSKLSVMEEMTPICESESNQKVVVTVEEPGIAEDLNPQNKLEEKKVGEEQRSLDASMDSREDTEAEVTEVKVSFKSGVDSLETSEVQHNSNESGEGVRNKEIEMEKTGSGTEADKSSTNVTLKVEDMSKVAGQILVHAADAMTDRMADEMAATLTDEMAATLTDEMADDMAEEVADRMVDEIEEKLTGEVPDKVTNEMADRMADEMADRMADEMADTEADKMADKMATRMADEMTDRMADEMADRMADEMADRMADEMADKMAAEMADELADEMADEVIEGDYGVGEEDQENVTESMEDGHHNEVGDMEEEEEEVEEDGQKMIDDNGEGTIEEQMRFVEELERFFKQRNMEYKAPKFYGLELNVLKLWRVVTRLGGYEHVTVSKLWRTVGEEFKPPKTCTTISWSFRGFYEKALLDYERFKTGVPAPGSSQRPGQMDGPFLGNENLGTVSPATPSSQPSVGGVSGSGRARRDAAARAMQGWHSQRMGNGEAKEPGSKEKGAGKYVKKEKKLTNLGGNGLKRKGTTTVLERAVKAVRAKGRPRLSEESPPSNSAVVNTGKRSIKQQDSMRRPVKVAKIDGPVGGFDPPIVDEGPKADWVKINVHKHLDCFEIYALVPGLAREEVRIQCEPGGRLVIAGMPEDPDNPWGVTPFRKVISLPSRIDAHQTSAVVTLYGQLYVRVPIAENKTS